MIPILQWEATAFGRPTLAIVLVVSLALFPVFLIPSGPSMWLAGMIFGYGLGFVIIMVGTTVGMVLPYLIGLMFRDRLHVRKKKPFALLDYDFFHKITLLMFFVKNAAMVEKVASSSYGS